MIPLLFFQFLNGIFAQWCFFPSQHQDFFANGLSAEQVGLVFQILGQRLCSQKLHSPRVERSLAMSNPVLVYVWVWGALPMGSDRTKSFQVGYDPKGLLFQTPISSSCYCCKLSGVMMLMNSVGQEFRQDPSRTECLCSIVSGVSAEQTLRWVMEGRLSFDGWSRNHLEMSSFNSEVDAGCHLGCVPEDLQLSFSCCFSIKASLELHIAW